MNDLEQSVQSAVLKSLRQSEQLRAVLGNNHIFSVEPDETMPTPFVAVIRVKEIEGANECWAYIVGVASNRASADFLAAALLQVVDDCPLLISPGIVGDVVSGVSEIDTSGRPEQFTAFVKLRIALERSAAKAEAA